MNKIKLPENGRRFAAQLLKWNREKNTRQMPWKGEKDPYKIWLSEIILQQTRVEQGLGYYQRFITAFPTVRQLARARDEKVFKLWEGLGYYSRCRNLLVTARRIEKDYKGRFPDTYEEIILLKGVGPYTAAAISSFAFNLPYAVLDGNVFRVLARIFGINVPVDSLAGKKYFTQLADQLMDKKEPGIYNQAIMDFGAVICKPAGPLCPACVFKKTCVALKKNRVNLLPVKEKKLTIKKRWFYYFVLEYKSRLAIRQRVTKDIWQDLFEFPMVEIKESTEVKTILDQAEKRKWIQKRKYELVFISPVFKQQLSHQLINGQFFSIRLSQLPVGNKEWIWLSKEKLNKYAFPRLINRYFSEKTGQASLF